MFDDMIVGMLQQTKSIFSGPCQTNIWDKHQRSVTENQVSIYQHKTKTDLFKFNANDKLKLCQQELNKTKQ